MTEVVDIINFSIAVSGLIVAAIGFLVGIISSYMEYKSRIFFVVFFFLFFLYVSSDLISQVSLILLGPEFQTLSMIAVFCESFFSSLLMPLLTTYMLSSSDIEWKKSPYFYGSICILTVYLVLLMSTWVSSKIYYITTDNVYHRGPLYPILLIPPVCLMLINLCILLRHKKNMPRSRAGSFALYIAITLASMLIQMFSYGLLTIVTGTCTAAALMLILIIFEQIRNHISTQEKNARIYAENLALQLRPHFIYNVLMSIYYLIEQDPDKARQVTLDFNAYLRKNFSSISSADMIPFSEELSHVKAYLAVEQVRFDGILFVDFDTPHTQFNIPPLTMQPIVENAVKHGVDPDLNPIHINLRTENTGTGSMITIENTGIPYDAYDNDDPHIALDNIRERLRSICRGSIDLTDMNGKGTKVVIFIPGL